MSSVQLRSISKLSVKEPPRAEAELPSKNQKEDEIIPVGPFTRFVRGIKGFWSTPTIDDSVNDDREAFIRTSLRELSVYLGFVVTVCLIAFLMLDSTMFYLTSVMQGTFVDGPEFDGLQNMDDFWKYVENDLLDGLYTEQYYDGSDVIPAEIGYIMSENKLFGKPRLRQLRVRNDSCKIHPKMEKEFNGLCYDHYRVEIEDQSDFRYPLSILNGTAWAYKTEVELDGRKFRGRMATYSGGGYTQLLADTKQDSTIILENLKKNLWLDRGTRVVFIDFTVYNANINMFNLVRLLFEFVPSGGCQTYRRFSTLKLLRYVTSTDYFVMACEGILFLYLLFYTIEEILEMKKLGIKYFKDFWSLMDLTVILIGFAALSMNLYRTFKVKTVLKDILDNREYYANFELLQYWQELYNDIIAVLCFFTWLKIFKYISFNATFGHLTGTLTRCAGDVAAFCISFMIVFIGFAHWGHLCFGTKIKDYYDFFLCFITLFRVMLGDFSFDDMYSANWTWGPVYFITYIFAVFFILLNMFMAIVNDTYAEVKEEAGDNEVDLGDIFKKGYDKMLTGLVLEKNNIVDIRKTLYAADANNDGFVDYEEWRTSLKARGHHDAEIEALFAKYDLDGDRILNIKEITRMQKDFEEREEKLDEEIEGIKQKKAEVKKMKSKLNLNEENGQPESDSEAESETSEQQVVTNEEFEILSRRVDNAEHSIGSIVSKVESLQVKLEAMDKAKAKHRETMARLIESIAVYEDKVKDASDILAAGSETSGSVLSTKQQGSRLSLSANSQKGSSFLRPKSSISQKTSKGSTQGSKLSVKFDK